MFLFTVGRETGGNMRAPARKMAKSSLQSIQSEFQNNEKRSEEIYGDERDGKDIKSNVFILFISFIPVNFPPLFLSRQICICSRLSCGRQKIV
jgi:hypothetical protein